MKPWLSLDAIFYATTDGRTFSKALKELHRYTKEVRFYFRDLSLNRASTALRGWLDARWHSNKE